MHWCVRQAEAEYLDPIISIWSSRMGDEYPDPQLVRNSIAERNCFVAMTSNEDICGFGILERLTAEDAAEKINNSVPIDYDEHVGLLDQLCVKKRYENNGIGTDLTRTRIEALRMTGIKKVIAVSWNCGEDTGNNEILESLGFTRHEVVDNYWRAESIRDDFSCPCGHPCTCTGVIYVNNLRT